MYYIGVDLGGTNIVVAIINEHGHMLDSLTSPTIKERCAQAIFDDIIFLIHQLLKRNQMTEADIGSIGIGVPGNIDLNKRSIIYANNLNLDNFPVVECLQKHFPVPIHLANDADCAVLGEFYYGSGKDYQDILMVTLGTGIGGAVVINKQLFSGFYPGGTEIGHMIIERNGQECTCGNKGCFEAYASATGLVTIAEHMMQQSDSVLHDLKAQNNQTLNAKLIFDAAAQGDRLASEILEHFYEYLAIGISNLINIFTPEVVIIGGGMSMQKNVLIEPMIEMVSKMVYGRELRSKIITAGLGNNAGLIGAGMLHKQFLCKEENALKK